MSDQIGLILIILTLTMINPASAFASTSFTNLIVAAPRVNSKFSLFRYFPLKYFLTITATSEILIISPAVILQGLRFDSIMALEQGGKSFSIVLLSGAPESFCGVSVMI